MRYCKCTSGKGLDVKTEDMDAAEVLPLARLEESCIESESFHLRKKVRKKMK